MPLQSGSSQSTISHNIEVEKKAHPDMPNAQAAAIAYSKAREGKDSIGKIGDSLRKAKK